MLLAPCALTVWRPLRSVMKAGPAKRRRRTTWSAQVGRPNPQVFRTFCRHDSSSRSRSIAASSPALTCSSLPYGASATRWATETSHSLT
jgi:hypothetical protein